MPFWDLANHASWLSITVCINIRVLVISDAAMISFKAPVSHELAQWNGFLIVFSSLSLSSAQAAGNAISWWNMLLRLDNTNT
jgi:hypothetical protein